MLRISTQHYKKSTKSGIAKEKAIVGVTDEFLDEVSQLLVLVGLAAQQIRDIVTGQVQASHE